MYTDSHTFADKSDFKKPGVHLVLSPDRFFPCLFGDSEKRVWWISIGSKCKICSYDSISSFALCVKVNFPLWLSTPISHSQNLGTSRRKKPMEIHQTLFPLSPNKNRKSSLGTRLARALFKKFID